MAPEGLCGESGCDAHLSYLVTNELNCKEVEKLSIAVSCIFLGVSMYLGLPFFKATFLGMRQGEFASE